MALYGYSFIAFMYLQIVMQGTPAYVPEALRGSISCLNRNPIRRPRSCDARPS